MSKSLFKIGIVAVLAAAVAALPLQLNAQTNQTAPAKRQAKPRTPSVTPFRGKLTAVDTTGKTITVGKRTIQITSETKILKGDKPATLEDAVVGENVTGGYRTQDGKMSATKVTLSAKATSPAKKSASKEEKKQM